MEQLYAAEAPKIRAWLERYHSPDIVREPLDWIQKEPISQISAFIPHKSCCCGLNCARNRPCWRHWFQFSRSWEIITAETRCASRLRWFTWNTDHVWLDWSSRQLPSVDSLDSLTEHCADRYWWALQSFLQWPHSRSDPCHSWTRSSAQFNRIMHYWRAMPPKWQSRSSECSRQGLHNWRQESNPTRDPPACTDAWEIARIWRVEGWSQCSKEFRGVSSVSDSWEVSHNVS